MRGGNQYIRTPEQNKKISDSLKKYFETNNHPWHGRKHSEESKKKIGLKSKNRIPNEITRKKMSLAHNRRECTDETKIKLSNSLKIYCKNRPKEHNENIGKSQLGIIRKPHNKITKLKIGQAQIGENNHNWKGGHSKTIEYKRWKSRNISHKRRFIMKQTKNQLSINEWNNMKQMYEYTCPSCHRKEPTIKLTIDHVIPLSKNGSHSIDNIQPLCNKCNSSKMTKTIIYKKQLSMGI